MRLSFPTEEETKEINKFVKRKSKKNTTALNKDSLRWTRTAWDNKLDYEVSWLGMPIIQNPYDIVLMQELIFKVKPDVIIEAGIAHGGSIIYYSSILELLGKGKVIGIDTDIREHNRKLLDKHPLIKRVTMLEGSSTDPKIVNKVKSMIKKQDKVMVILDSDHTKGHVYDELNVYKEIVSVGSYVVVFDTFMPKLIGLPRTENFKGNTAMDAVEKFLDENKKFFEVDKNYNKYFVSSCPDGFLKRLK